MVAAALWLGLRLTLLRDLADWRAPDTVEVLVALGVGYILGGLLATVRETWANQANQAETLADTCGQLGYTFSAGVVDPTSLPATRLLRHYLRIRDRMSGGTDGVPVELSGFPSPSLCPFWRAWAPECTSASATYSLPPNPGRSWITLNVR